MEASLWQTVSGHDHVVTDNPGNNAYRENYSNDDKRALVQRSVHGRTGQNRRDLCSALSKNRNLSLLVKFFVVSDLD
jgi:hypothetical protein